MKVSDYIMEFLAFHGIRHVFMVAGGGSMHLVDSLGRNKNLEYVCCLHEQAAAMAAVAYAEYTGRPGAVLVTTGPGGTNAITGVAEAWMESAPVIFISGQVRKEHLNYGQRSRGPQEIDIVPIVKPITKYATTIKRGQETPSVMTTALYCATDGRYGPVWIEVPLDVQAGETDGCIVTQVDTYYSEKRIKGKIARSVELMKQARHPVLLIGNGARRSGLIEELVNRLKIPTLLTWKAIDILPEDNQFYCGRPGAIASRGANFTQQNADFLMTIGARLDFPQIAFSPENFAPRAVKVIVDVDYKELDKIDAEVSIHADAKQFIEEILTQIDELPDWSSWVQQSKKWQKKYPVILPEYWKSELVNPYVLIDVLSDLCTPDDVLAPGSSGACSDMFLQVFRVKRGQRVINSPSLGAMGTGLPGSIGACLASGGRRTICVNGDGGFSMNIQELETVKRLNLPIKFFVLCNGTYASIVNTQKAHFGGHLVGSDPSSGLTLPDVMKVAEAYGIRSFALTNHETVSGIVGHVLSCEGPALCAVSVSDQQTVPRATSFLNKDGTMVSLPMEDMAPLLPRDEFEANMLREEK